MNPPLVSYTKPALSYPDQVARLQSRGLVVNDLQRAEQFLRHVNYYRFAAYCLPFESQRHVFLPGTAFEQIEVLHEFDRVLRDLLNEALEVVELDFRTAIAYHFGHKYAAFGHITAGNFEPHFGHRSPPYDPNAPSWYEQWRADVRREADRSQEQFVKHFKAKYAEYPDLPVWTLAEIMSFGSLSRMYGGMYNSDQSAIARPYGVPADVLKSWMHHVVYVRNICAHHSRLWDKTFVIRPIIPRRIPAWNAPYLTCNNKLFVTLLVLNSLLKRIKAVGPFATEWRKRVTMHLQQLPSTPAPLDAMGLTPNWRSHPFWQ